MKKFFNSQTKEGKVSEIVEKLACNLSELHFKYGKLTTASLNGFYRMGALGNNNGLFASVLGYKLIEVIEREDKVAVHFHINERADNASMIQVEILPISQYEWDDLYYEYDGMKGNGVCFSFIFNRDLEHSPHWLHLEAA